MGARVAVGEFPSWTLQTQPRRIRRIALDVSSEDGSFFD
jgi:hypothetical protein